MKSLAIICGGQSHEYDISLISATSVIENIDRSKYDIHILIIDKDGSIFHTRTLKGVKNDAWKAFPDLCPALISPNPSLGAVLRKTENGFESIGIDVFFPVMHGENCEDGVIQGLLKMSHVPYVGGGTLSSACCMDKEITHILLDSHGIKTAPYIVATVFDCDADKFDKKIRERFGYPVFIKPANAGSSVGVSRVNSKDELEAAFKTAFEVDRKILIEKMIVGKEIECAVIGNDEPRASEVLGEIGAAAQFYDFDAKYVSGETKLYIPARIGSDVCQKVRNAAVTAYKILGCRSLARVDFFVFENGEYLINEVNNIPGFTSISMYPKLLTNEKYTYTDLIDELISLAESK